MFRRLGLLLAPPATPHGVAPPIETWRLLPPRRSFRRPWRLFSGARSSAVPPRFFVQPPRVPAWRTPRNLVRHVAYGPLRRGVPGPSWWLYPPRLSWAWRSVPPRRGAWRSRPFRTPRVAYFVFSRVSGPPRGFGLPDAWRTALSPQPPRGWAWRLGTPRVAYPVPFVRHAFAPAWPCVLSHRAPGRRPARSSSARSGCLPCPGECLPQSSSRAADWQESAAGVVLPGVFLLLVWLSQLFVRPQAVEAPVGPGALPAAPSVGSSAWRCRRSSVPGTVPWPACRPVRGLPGRFRTGWGLRPG